MRVPERGREIIDIRLAAPEGAYVAQHAAEPSCWGCDLYLLEIYVPPALADHWDADLAAAMNTQAWVPAP